MRCKQACLTFCIMHCPIKTKNMCGQLEMVLFPLFLWLMVRIILLSTFFFFKRDCLWKVYSCELVTLSSTIFAQNAVLALDSSALDIDQVENLIKFCPTKEEMETLKAFTLSLSLSCTRTHTHTALHACTYVPVHMHLLTPITNQFMLMHSPC